MPATEFSPAPRRTARPGEIETLAEHLLAPLDQGCDERPDVRQGYKLEDPFGRHREDVPGLAQSTDRPPRDGILHESDRRADRVGDAELDQILLDEILAFEMRDARPLVGVGDGRIDQMPDPGSLRGVGGNDPPTGLPLRPGFVAIAHQKHSVDVARSLHDGRCVAEIASDDIGTRRRQTPSSDAVGLAGQRYDAMPPGQQGARNRPSLLNIVPRLDTMLDLNDIVVFARVVEAGSFIAAARTLGMPKTTVSRRIFALECFTAPHATST